jgi:hypothetical protein
MNVIMENGKIYSISFGSNTQIVCRYRKDDGTNHLFYSHLHYWNGFETYRVNGHCQNLNITEIREASKSKKHNLFSHEVEHGDV